MLKKLTTPVEAALRLQQISFHLYASGVGGTLFSLGFEIGRRGLTYAKLWPTQAQPLDSVFGRNLARTFANLGPTFIKLGQVLSTRPDLVGEPVAEELRILLERVPPVRFRDVRRILRAELGKDRLRATFRSIEERPLASASLSQTHEAELNDGTKVILKIQKPGVAHTVQMDLKILEGLAQAIHFVHPKRGVLPAFEDFKAATLREIDYREEAKNIDRFKKNYSGLFSSAPVKFPAYYPDLLTAKLIVLEPMQGLKFGTLQKGTTHARQAAAGSVHALLEQIFDHGFFHADPHAGNLFFLEDSGKVGFIDLGLVGHLDVHDKKKFLKVLLAILQRDREKLAKSLFDLGTAGKTTDYAAFEAGIHELLDGYAKRNPSDLRLDKMVQALFTVARKNSIYIPNRYVMMARSCLIIEGVAKSLDPNLNIVQLAIPIVARSLVKSYNPLRWLGRR